LNDPYRSGLDKSAYPDPKGFVNAKGGGFRCGWRYLGSTELYHVIPDYATFDISFKITTIPHGVE
jgi:hypothetical protein